MMSFEIPQDVIERAAKFRGHSHHLEAAIGAYVVGQLYGWRVLLMVHGIRTYNRFQDILGLKFQDVCPRRTALSDRVVGIRLADKAGAFWAYAKGERAGRERFQISDDDRLQGDLL